MNFIRKVALLVGALAVSTASQAAVFRVHLNVSTIASPVPCVTTVLGCLDPGDGGIGYFSVPDIELVDGVHDSHVIAAFYLTLNRVAWSQPTALQLEISGGAPVRFSGSSANTVAQIAFEVGPDNGRYLYPFDHFAAFDTHGEYVFGSYKIFHYDGPLPFPPGTGGTVPEPGSLALLGIGALAAFMRRLAR